MGTVLIHGDFWLEHVIISSKNNRLYVIDWDYSSAGSPYEDFVTVQTSIINQFNHREDFWEGYGLTPDKHTINEFVKLQCLRQFSFTTANNYLKESPHGFYHRQMHRHN